VMRPELAAARTTTGSSCARLSWPRRSTTSIVTVYRRRPTSLQPRNCWGGTLESG
jgi:hypothetical protein